MSDDPIACALRTWNRTQSGDYDRMKAALAAAKAAEFREMRLFRVVARAWDMPHGMARRLIRAGLISVDGEVEREESLLVRRGVSVGRLDYPA
jgi:hypothetical protein